MSKFAIRTLPTGIKFDLKATNGQIIASSELYKTRAACLKGIRSIQKNAPLAALEDQTAEEAIRRSNPKFELYRDRSGQFRFRLRSPNGRIIAVSEGYVAKASCENGIESVRKNAMEAEITEE